MSPRPSVTVGDIFSVRRGIVVHGCNAQGVMGAGFAKTLRQRHPGAYSAYVAEHKAHGLQLGKVVFFEATPDLLIANAITQEFYGRAPGRRYVDYGAIAKSLSTVASMARERSLPVFYPMIGCGLAGGEWSSVAPIIRSALDGLEHGVFVLPGETPPEWPDIGSVDHDVAKPGGRTPATRSRLAR